MLNIEIKNLKVSRSLSEETTAFTANLYVDGFHAYAVSNHGQGGCNSYYPVGKDVPSEKEIEARIVAAGKAKADDFEILDGFIGDLIDDEEARKRLSRMLKTKIVILGEHGGQPALFTYPAKVKPTPTNIAAVKARLKAGQALVNGDRALESKALALV
jgi:hypothetical protein